MKYVFMNDKERYKHILKHYEDLLDEYEKMKQATNEDLKASLFKKCIYMDLFQIGEHVNRFSKQLKAQIKKTDVRGIVDIRNKIGHAYFAVDPEIIEDTILNDCPRLIARLNELFE